MSFQIFDNAKMHWQITFLKIEIRFRQEIQTLKNNLTQLRALPPFLSTNVNHTYDYRMYSHMIK